MAGLLEHDKTKTPDAPEAATPVAPEAPAGEPAGAPVAPVVRPCTTCAAPLADGQDWCLECGSAQPGRLGTRAGWRAALSVAGACAVLATGAGAAAYAALSSESQRVASAPPPPAATPIVTPPPVVPAPPPEAADTPTVEAPASEGADVPPAKAPDIDPPSASSPGSAGTAGSAGSAGSSGSSGAPSGGDDAGATDASPEPVAIDLAADSASTYDPSGRGGGDVGDPADAVDGKSTTAWEAPVDSEGKVDIGLAVSLDEARTLSKLAFAVDTPGFTVEIYGSRAEKLPPDVLDARWENIDTTKDVGVREEVELKGKYRHVLLWVTTQPADTKVGINSFQLFD